MFEGTSCARAWQVEGGVGYHAFMQRRTFLQSLGVAGLPALAMAKPLQSHGVQRQMKITAVETDLLHFSPGRTYYDAIHAFGGERGAVHGALPIAPVGSVTDIRHPVTGPERQQFIERAQLDFQDFAMVGDAQWTFVDGVLTLTIDLRPS